MSSTFTGLLRTLKSTSSACESMLFSSCESELTELMHQIDVMVENKRAEWQQQIHGVQLQCEHKERELVKLRQTIEDRNKEVGQLQQKNDFEEDKHKKMISRYESQLGQLKSEMENLKKSYSKLQRNANKQTLDAENIAQQLNIEKQKGSQELQKAIMTIEELEFKVRDLETAIEVQNTKLKGLEEQRRSFVEKSELMQNQLLSYQGQLTRKKQLMDNLEQKHVTRIAELENEVMQYKDELEIKVETVKSLKQSLEERKLEVEKNWQDQHQIASELESFRNKLEKKEKQTLALENKILALQRQTKMQESEMGKNKRDTEDIDGLRKTIAKYQHEVRSRRKNEEDLLNMSKKQQKRISELEEECLQLQKESADKALQNSLQGKPAPDSTEFRNRQNQQEESHSAEMEGMKRQISSLIGELNRRDIALAKMSQKTGKMEEDLREMSAKSDKNEAQLQVSHAQLEALRLENRYLRDASVEDHLSTTAHLRMFESHISEIESSNARVTAQLEDENAHLKSELASMRDEHDKLIAANFEHPTKGRENDKTTLLSPINQSKQEDNTNERITSLQEQLDQTIKNYEEKLQELQSQNAAFCGDETQTTDHQQPERAMPDDDVKFSEAIDSPRNSTKRENSDNEDVNLSNLFDMLGDASFASGNTSRRASLTREFNSEEDHREKELQKLLEARINDLELRTNATIKKYQL